MMRQRPILSAIRRRRGPNRLALGLMLLFFPLGCAMTTEKPRIADTRAAAAAGTILSGKTGRAVTFAELMEALSAADIIYIGEKHNRPEHHDVQVRIIEQLNTRYGPVTVGMEMFDHTYQPLLDRWSAGELDETAFLENVHWDANWKYDFALYRNILNTIREHRIPLKGLNLPFHLPPKIAAGGIDSLSPAESAHLAADIDLTNARHRAYVEEIFHQHPFGARKRFDYFYMAQCAWEETMAAAVARHDTDGKLVVLAGSGHIIHKFGIPDRAYARRPRPFVTILPVTAGEEFRTDAADYIWITP